MFILYMHINTQFIPRSIVDGLFQCGIPWSTQADEALHPSLSQGSEAFARKNSHLDESLRATGVMTGYLELVPQMALFKSDLLDLWTVIT